MRAEDDESKDEDGGDHRLVAEREAVDDVGGGARAARVGDLLHGLVREGRVVLSDEADGAAAPQAEADAEEGGKGVGAGARDVKGGGEEGVTQLVERGRHERRGDKELELEGGLDVGLALYRLDVGGDEGREEADDDARAGDGEGEEERAPAGGDDGVARGADEERGAGGLAKRAKEVGAHAGHVADVVAHVVRDRARVVRVVLRQVLHHLARQVGTHVGGLGIDAAADAPKHGNRRAAEAKAGDAIHQLHARRLLGGVVVGGKRAKQHVEH
mmetsp:Transcript_40308/g.106218  ORF Transcript_40308/g.106218 Transcript_40308/m.106218 type:complete len:272 (-) Transcript_40308:624-1439(-)